MTARRAGMALLLAAALPAAARAWTPEELTDVGVAALDPATGRVLWEVWRPDELPATAPPAVLAAARDMLKPTLYRLTAEPDAPGLPAALGPDRVVTTESADGRLALVLKAGTPAEVGAEVARVALPAEGWRYAPSGAGAVAVLAGDRVRWFTLHGAAGESWKPDWSADLPARPESQGWLAADAGGAWVARGPEVHRLAAADGKRTAFAVPDPWPHPGGSQPAVTPGAGRLYCRQSGGVVALDAATGAALWAHPTPRGPTGGRVVEAGGVVLVQIASSAPVTLRSALFGGEDAIPGMAATDPPRQAAAAALLHAYGEGYLKPRVRDTADRLRKQPGGAKHAAAIDRLLAAWPAGRDRDRLAGACAAALLDANPAPAADTPAGQRLLCWRVLQELVYGRLPEWRGHFSSDSGYHVGAERPLALSDAARAALVGHCRRVVAAGPGAERPFAASVLASAGWDRLADDERRGLLLSADPGVWRWAAAALARRGRRADLVAWARGRPAADHLDVLSILTEDPPKDLPADELAFWVGCTTRDTPGAAGVLATTAGRPRPRSAPRSARTWSGKSRAPPTSARTPRPAARRWMPCSSSTPGKTRPTSLSCSRT